MGSPVKPPRSPGDDCVHCDEEGCSSGVTPADIQVTFSGIVNCPLVGGQPPDGPYVLLQDAVDPCLWTYDGPDFFIGAECLGGGTKVYATGALPVGTPNYFLGFTFDDCSTSVTNSYVACVGGVGSHSGVAAIQWT